MKISEIWTVMRGLRRHRSLPRKLIVSEIVVCMDGGSVIISASDQSGADHTISFEQRKFESANQGEVCYDESPVLPETELALVLAQLLEKAKLNKEREFCLRPLLRNLAVYLSSEEFRALRGNCDIQTSGSAVQPDDAADGASANRRS